MKNKVQKPILNSNNTSGITTYNSYILLGNKFYIKKIINQHQFQNIEILLFSNQKLLK